MLRKQPQGARMGLRLGLIGLILAGCIWSLFSQPRGAAQPDIRVFSGQTMGTYYTIKVLWNPALAEEDERRIKNAIQEQLDLVNQRMSTYRADSELSRFNRFDSTEPFEITKPTLDVFTLAQDVSKVTGGAFDITVGPLVNAWGFGPDPPTLSSRQNHESTISEEQIQRLRSRVGYQHLHIDRDAFTVRKDVPEMYCDLSGIAKGYGVDRVFQALSGLGLDSFMIEVGGEIRTKGTKAGRPWRIAIEKPSESTRVIHEVLNFPKQGLALATSGDYRNYYEANGKRYSHTIDPRTGRPVEHNLASVSVLASTCTAADAYATALNVMGPDRGLEFARDHNLAAMFITRTGAGAFTETRTPAYEHLSD